MKRGVLIAIIMAIFVIIVLIFGVILYSIMTALEENKGNETDLVNDSTVKCSENWECVSWNPEVCPESEIQTRTCQDSNDCGTQLEKPDTTRECEYISETCLDKGGEVCTFGYECNIATISASDTSECCTGSCVELSVPECVEDSDCDNDAVCSIPYCTAHQTCAYTAITHCNLVLDNCCPVGCNHDNDPDCEEYIYEAEEFKLRLVSGILEAEVKKNLTFQYGEDLPESLTSIYKNTDKICDGYVIGSLFALEEINGDELLYSFELHTNYGCYEQIKNDEVDYVFYVGDINFAYTVDMSSL